jgi:serine/threonine protein kinase
MSMIGRTLGNFEITSQLGKGGMGEVYQAKDRKLGRDVAIKVLPEEFARDTDRVARFQREAKLLASLNHPNIAAIYGLEESGGTNFLVLELVGGETLADQLKRGPIPVEESLKLALQIAEALEAAHEKGVIHRDLKPANIKVTPEGKVKVLDFGLAKTFAGEQADLNLSSSPTLSDAATQQGVILGTAAYMSPEQARGKPVDKKADIWAFGCVLFEMLAGQAAFQGEDVTEILAAVVRGGVNLDLLPVNIHPRVREVITRCLQKEQKRRYPEIGEAHYEIEMVLSDPSGVFTQPVTAAEPRTRLRTILPWIAASIVLGAIIAGVAVWKLKPAESKQVMRFDYELPEAQEFENLARSAVAVSPDGKQFVYTTPKGLYLRFIDELTAKPIAGTEGNLETPFFSPDGKWIGYWSRLDSKLKKISISGGAPVTLCDAGMILGADWGADNTIVYGKISGGIMRISGGGGKTEPIIKAGALPNILPGGKSVLYTGPQLKIMVQSLKSGETQELFAGYAARYLPAGYLVYSVENNVFAVPFDADKLKVSGEPVSVIEGVLRFLIPQYAVSDSGMLVYIPGTASSAIIQLTPLWVDRKGKEEPLAAAPNAYFFPRISPDGTRVAFSVGGPRQSDIWIWNLARKNLTRLTFDSFGAVALWAPDGKRIAYASEADGGVYWKASDGTGKIDRLASVPGALLYPWSWSNKGKTLVLEDYSGGGSNNIGSMSLEGDRKWKPLLQEKYAERQPQISLDGRYIAYSSNESGKQEVYVRPFPDVDSGGRWQVSTDGGENPLWSPDGRELFYRNGDAIMAVSVIKDPSFSIETPKILFRGKYFSPGTTVGTSWDISPDGKRFLMMKENAVGGPRKINIVLNWFEELKQRVPVK